MSRLLITLLSTVLVGSLSTSQTVEAESFYKWTDDEGTIHYTRTPPKGRDAQKINTQTKTSKPVNYNKPQSESEKASTGTTTVTAESTKNPARCEQAHKNLKTLSNAARVRITTPEGEKRYLSPDELQNKKKEMQKAIKESC